MSEVKKGIIRWQEYIFMNGSVIVGILFKYAPLLLVCFLVDFFHFPLPPSLPFPFFLLSPLLAFGLYIPLSLS